MRARDRLRRFFGFDHLPPQLRDAARPFAEVADLMIAADVTDEVERLHALRKLLEAKDCFVRSCLMIHPQGGAECQKS